MTAEHELAVMVGFLLAMVYATGTWWILKGEPRQRGRRLGWCAGVLALASVMAALAHEFLGSGWGVSFAVVCGLSAIGRDRLERRGVL